jgi:4-hydroxybenzoate polyprenyltransferase
MKNIISPKLKQDIVSQLRNYGKLMRVDKPIGVWLLLWPTLWALWLAGEGHPNQGLFAVFVIGVFVMRSAGCVLNDYVDRKIDPYVERTRTRPIASGAVAPTEALVLFVALSLIAVGLASMLNQPARMLAIIAAGLTVAYPFIKRFVSIPQFVLGAAFGWAVPMAFAAQTGSTPQLAWLVFGAAVIWAVIYDTFYAMVDREDDKKLGVKSTAILFGDVDLFVIAGLQILMLAALVFIGLRANLGFWYFFASRLFPCIPAQSLHRLCNLRRYSVALCLQSRTACAIARALTFAAPAASKTLASSRHVAPVVITSSIINTCR